MTDATPSGRAKDDLTGHFLEGRYRVERLLGRGGMGSVFLAEDERMRRKVVVKVPHARFLEEEGLRAVAPPCAIRARLATPPSGPEIGPIVQGSAGSGRKSDQRLAHVQYIEQRGEIPRRAPPMGADATASEERQHPR